MRRISIGTGSKESILTRLDEAKYNVLALKMNWAKLGSVRAQEIYACLVWRRQNITFYDVRAS